MQKTKKIGGEKRGERLQHPQKLGEAYKRNGVTKWKGGRQAINGRKQSQAWGRAWDKVETEKAKHHGRGGCNVKATPGKTQQVLGKSLGYKKRDRGFYPRSKGRSITIQGGGGGGSVGGGPNKKPGCWRGLTEVDLGNVHGALREREKQNLFEKGGATTTKTMNSSKTKNGEKSGGGKDDFAGEQPNRFDLGGDPRPMVKSRPRFKGNSEGK